MITIITRRKMIILKYRSKFQAYIRTMWFTDITEYRLWHTTNWKHNKINVSPECLLLKLRHSGSCLRLQSGVTTIDLPYRTKSTQRVQTSSEDCRFLFLAVYRIAVNKESFTNSWIWSGLPQKFKQLFLAPRHTHLQKISPKSVHKVFSQRKKIR